MGETHTYLKLAELVSDFVGVPVQGYSKEAMARIFACTAEGADKFAEEWIAKEWYKSKTFVGSIADDAETISQEQGWPTARTSSATGKRNAWRFAGFIFLMP